MVIMVNSESNINLLLHLILVLLTINQQHHGYSNMLDIYEYYNTIRFMIRLMLCIHAA